MSLKKTGLPYDTAVGALRVWARKNHPANGRRSITHREVAAQAGCAYAGAYTSCGCEDEAVARYCDQDCPIRKRGPGKSEEEEETDEGEA